MYLFFIGFYIGYILHSWINKLIRKSVDKLIK